MNNPSQPTQSQPDPSNLFPFDEYMKGRGLTRYTGWRYRKQGLIGTVNIFGRLYCTREQIEAFERKAINGDFHKEAKTPARRNSSPLNNTPPKPALRGRPGVRGRTSGTEAPQVIHTPARSARANA